MVYTTDGIMGLPARVAATYAFMFVMFGTFLYYAKGSDFFYDFAAAISGRQVGGPAKIAVVVFGLVRHDLGQPNLGRSHHRRHYHPDDEAARLPRLGSGCDRSCGFDRRQLDAAGDGLGRIHHGGIYWYRICRNRQSRAVAGIALLRRCILPGSFSRLSARPRCAQSRIKSQNLRRRCARAGCSLFRWQSWSGHC